MSYRSLAAPWIGGASGEPAPAAAAGYRSLFALWAGGAGGIAPVDQGAGARSLLAFWMGGAAQAPAIDPVVPSRSWSASAVERDALNAGRVTNDELLLLLAWRVSAGALH